MTWSNRLLLAAVIAGLAVCGPAALSQTREIQDQVQAELLAKKQSSGNLRQIAIAMHNYHSVFRQLPTAAFYDKNGKATLSWRVILLPFLEQNELYKQFNFEEPWDSEHNKKLLDKMPDVYRSPKTKGPQSTTYYQVITGAGTVFEGRNKIRFVDITDGTSNTILAVEAGEAVPWTKPADVGYDAKKPLPKFGGLFKDGFHILWCDGSVRFARRKFDQQTFRDAITRAGGEVLQMEKLMR
jgi:uncharacterized protein DUF1559